MDWYVLSSLSKSHMEYFLQDGKNGTSCFVQDGKSVWECLSPDVLPCIYVIPLLAHSVFAVALLV